jgi:hypothetical protein
MRHQILSRGFEEGQLVRLQSGSGAGSRDVPKRNASAVPPTGLYEVVQRLTGPDGEPFYRIRRLDDLFERIVRESQLIPAMRDQ